MRSLTNQHCLTRPIGDFTQSDGAIAEEGAVTINAWLGSPEHAYVLSGSYVTNAGCHAPSGRVAFGGGPNRLNTVGRAAIRLDDRHARRAVRGSLNGLIEPDRIV